MARKDMKAALGASLKAEEKAVKTRFDRAEALLEKSKKATTSSRKTGNHGRVIRDSFTMPESDHSLISTIKERCLNAGVNANKSEIIRAGLNALAEMSDGDLLEVVQNLSKVKTGRPTE